MTHGWVFSAMTRPCNHSTLATVPQPAGQGCSDGCWPPRPLLVPASPHLPFLFAERSFIYYSSSMPRAQHPSTMHLDWISLPGPTILLDLGQTLLCFKYFFFCVFNIVLTLLTQSYKSSIHWFLFPCFNTHSQLLKNQVVEIKLKICATHWSGGGRPEKEDFRILGYCIEGE